MIIVEHSPGAITNRAQDAILPHRIIDSRFGSVLAVALLTVLYVLLVSRSITRHLWFDELFTYYIAQAPTFRQMAEVSSRVDLNPPLIYWLVRLCHQLFGVSEVSTRLPAALGFHVANIAVFLFLKRRIGVLWGAAAVVAFWSTPYFSYATQARPYGLLLGFFAATLFSYDRATSNVQRRGRALGGIAAGSAGMMMSHVFAPLSILPFCAAESVRCLQKRRIDWPVWITLAMPMLLGLQNLAALRHFERIYFPAAFQASAGQISSFYFRMAILYVLPGIVLAAIAAFVVLPFSAKRESSAPIGKPALAWIFVVLSIPVIVNLLLMRNGGAFWERYCITSALAFFGLVSVTTGKLANFRPASATAFLIVICTICFVRPAAGDDHAPYPNAFNALPHDLPLVADSGLTFLEMDKYTRDDVRSRLFYLTDRESAIRYAHATIFENMPLLKQYFPIRAHVSAYNEFVKRYSQFLVISRIDTTEEWVIRRSKADGAKIRTVATLRGPDETFLLYEIQR